MTEQATPEGIEQNNAELLAWMEQPRPRRWRRRQAQAERDAHTSVSGQ